MHGRKMGNKPWPACSLNGHASKIEEIGAVHVISVAGLSCHQLAHCHLIWEQAYSKIHHCMPEAGLYVGESRHRLFPMSIPNAHHCSTCTMGSRLPVTNSTPPPKMPASTRHKGTKQSQAVCLRAWCKTLSPSMQHHHQMSNDITEPRLRCQPCTTTKHTQGTRPQMYKMSNSNTK